MFCGWEEYTQRKRRGRGFWVRKSNFGCWRLHFFSFLSPSSFQSCSLEGESHFNESFFSFTFHSFRPGSSSHLGNQSRVLFPTQRSSSLFSRNRRRRNFFSFAKSAIFDTRRSFCDLSQSRKMSLFSWSQTSKLLSLLLLMFFLTVCPGKECLYQQKKSLSLSLFCSNVAHCY